MFERFHWRRLGGSVLRYSGEQKEDGSYEEDWLNHVAPALMFMRAFLLKNGVTLKYFTLDASSVSHVDHSDSETPLGHQPQPGQSIGLVTPTNPQSSESSIRAFVDAATNAT